MTKIIGNAGVDEVFLNPGDFHFHCPVPGRPQPARLRTLLGSCVSIILWHPERRLAGMSHAVLPSQCRGGKVAGLDGRFCDETIKLFCGELDRTGTRPQEFFAYLVGGGKMFQTQHDKFSIGDRNIEAARQYLKQAKFTIFSEHVGMQDYRKVQLDLMSGEVTVTFGNKLINLTKGGIVSNTK